MPEWFIYLFMLALLSAGMSTLSSQFHAMGTSIGRDFFENIFPKHKFNTVRISKLGIMFAILISVIIGYKLPGSIVARGTAIFFGVCAAAFLPVYFAALYWKKVTQKAAIYSILSGVLASIFALAFMHVKESEPLGICQAIFGKPTLATEFPWMIVDPMLIALPVSIFVLVVFTFITPKQPAEHIEKCFKRIG
jgi:SSS family solute:Na+ symporter